MKRGIADKGIDAFTQFQAACVSGDSEVHAHAAQLVSTLCEGVLPYVRAATCQGTTLHIELTHALRGEIATRSRVPVELILEEKLSIIVSELAGVDEEETASVKIQGLSWGQVQGAEEIYEVVANLWAESGAETYAAKRRVAWDWWTQNDSNFDQTKLWRLVTSLTHHKKIRLALNTTMKGDLLVGLLCSTPAQVISFHFSRYDGKIQVTMKKKPLRGVQDQESRWAIAEGQQRERLEAGGYSRLGPEKLVPSCWNWGLLTGDVNAYGERAADPSVICRLFQGATKDQLGGATRLECAMGSAQFWQQHDCTHQLSGSKAGRVVWRPQSKA